MATKSERVWRARAKAALLCAALAPLGLAACASAPQPSMGSTSALTGARYKVGAPYQAGGVWYVPAYQPHYDEVGLASWYGDQFHGRATANGERFDMEASTGAHATLPMPSIVEVTNLENGRTLRVRLNDRGPFHPGRIVDLSRGAAERLGFAAKGTARVRVRYVGPAPLLEPGATMVAARAPAPVPDEAPPAPEAPAYAGAFAVQAGAFADRGNADRAAARLAVAGRASIRPLDREGGRLYRVMLGPWPDEAQAQGARAQVAELGFGAARVVPAL